MAQIVVIGGGPAGIVAATEAARQGAHVTLVEREHVGGRATWHSLLPSKVWLTAADRLGARHADAALGIHGETGTVDIASVTRRIATLSQTTGERYHAQLAAAGVTVLHGEATFEDATHVRVASGESTTTLAADAIIVATGSGPRFLPEVKPDGKRIIAPRLMGKLGTVPASMIMLGAGVTGAEFAYMFQRLGAQITWVTDLPEILPLSDPDIKGHLADAFTAQGMTILTSSPVAAAQADDAGVTVTLQDGRTLRAEMAFIAIGRVPHTQGLNLEAAGLPTTQPGIAVNAFGQSAVPSVYAVGDVANPPMTANKAMAQAYIAARHAAGAPVNGYRAEAVVEAVYTEPQIAQVGLTEKVAASQGRSVRVVRRAYADNLKAHLAGHAEGFLKLVIDASSGQVVGGAAVGAHAADILAPLAVALTQRVTTAELAHIFAGHPTLSELLFDAVRAV